MLKVGVTFFWISVTLYAISAFLYICSLVFKKDWLKIATLIAFAGLISHSVAIVLHWIASGHGPYIGMYEIISSNVWLGVAIFLGVQYWFRKARVAGAIVMPLSFLLMGLGATSPKGIEPLPPALQSYWLIIHVTFAKLSYGSFLVATALAVLFILKGRKLEKGASSDFYERLPSLELLDDLSFRLITSGFVFLAIMIVTGSIWANKAWGRYWGWDPIETWSLITWLVYGIYLHLRVVMGWRGRKSAWLIIVALCFLLFTLFGLPFVYRSIHAAYFSR